MPGIRRAATVALSIAATVAIAVLLVGKWDQLGAGVTAAPLLIVAAAAALQVVALVSRSEAWHVCVRASGGTVGRRRLYRASSMGFIGGLLNGQLSSAARIAALRRSAPEQSPRVPALIAAELPILVVEAMLAALTSFTLVGPLGLPWWLPLVCVAGVASIGLGLGRFAAGRGRWLAEGLAVARSLHGRNRVIGFVLIAVVAQIARNWLVLHAVGVDASLFDAIAVLIAVVSLGQLPFGLSVGAAASVLILGPHGVSAAAAAGVLLTATGTVGGLAFAAWAGVDSALGHGRVKPLIRAVSTRTALSAPVQARWAALLALGAQLRRGVERSCFDVLGHLQPAPVLAAGERALVGSHDWPGKAPGGPRISTPACSAASVSATASTGRPAGGSSSRSAGWLAARTNRS
jgi:hypothetical protein